MDKETLAEYKRLCEECEKITGKKIKNNRDIFKAYAEKFDKLLLYYETGFVNGKSIEDFDIAMLQAVITGVPINESEWYPKADPNISY